MDNSYTLMLIPDRNKKVRSLRIPKIVVHSAAFLAALFSLLLAILVYDYWKILEQIYENKYLAAENHQLREQVQVFQMKLNTLTQDLERIHIFEKKLRVISGVENADFTQDQDAQSFPASNLGERPLRPGEDLEGQNKKGGRLPQSLPAIQGQSTGLINDSEEIFNLLKSESFRDQKEFKDIEGFYKKKLAESIGVQMGMAMQGPLGELLERLLKLGPDLALFDYKYSKIKKLSADLEVRISDLDQFLLDRESFIESMPTILPSKGWITSFYGPRVSPITRQPRFHEGLDVGASIGTPIFAAASGMVIFAGHRPGLGNYVQIDHGYGLETVYAHASSLVVRPGAQVKRGQIIAKVGNTGYSTAPHLHYEIRVNGIAVDPLYYILN